MKSFKLLVFSAATFLISIMSLQAVSAQGVNDFVITSFTAEYTLTNRDPQGYLEIIETIELDYSGLNRGILRALPNTYKGNDLNLDVVSVVRDNQSESFITYEENDNTVIRIGDADTSITGKHNYEIIYTVENVVSFYDDYDELYWDINGNQWLQLFENVSVDLDTNAPAKPGVEAECFTGLYGSSTQNCIVKSKTNGLSADTTQSLQPEYTLTIVQAYEKGYFIAPTFLESYSKYWPILPFFIAQIYAVFWTYRRWRKYGKDYKARATTPFFGRPKNTSVMQASYLQSNRLSASHISAAIIDLSIRGYIKIIEYKDGNKTKHSLELLKLASTSLEEDEKILLEDLFSSNKVGATLNLEDNKNKLYKTTKLLSSHIDSTLKAKGLYEITPKESFSKMTAPFAFSVIAGLAGVFLGELTNGVSIVITGICSFAVIILSAHMNKRSLSGVALVEHMDGLGLYLKKAESDRINMQDAVEAPLAPLSGEPTRDVKFFEKLLPFAVASGQEKTWANAFKDIYSQPPEWFKGDWTTFNTSALASSLSDTTKAASQSFTSPSSSGSSGSGGGGFSGGGGGGGGGGGW